MIGLPSSINTQPTTVSAVLHSYWTDWTNEPLSQNAQRHEAHDSLNYTVIHMKTPLRICLPIIDCAFNVPCLHRGTMTRCSSFIDYVATAANAQAGWAPCSSATSGQCYAFCVNCLLIEVVCVCLERGRKSGMLWVRAQCWSHCSPLQRTAPVASILPRVLGSRG